MDHYHEQAGCFYEWDPVKAATNLQKHHVSFELACEIFNDPHLLSVQDKSESYAGEERWQHLGQVDGCLILLVVTTDREENVRIISARSAVSFEKKIYLSGGVK